MLDAAARGDREAWDRLAPRIYEELHRIAGAAMGNERRDHTLQPTALVHEAFVRLTGSTGSAWNNRAHFFGAAAKTMRRILIEHARRRGALKRGGGAGERVPLDQVLVDFESTGTDLLALDAALARLAEFDAERARLVELRFFGGMTVEQTALAMGVSPSSVERGWRVARAWLLAEIAGAERSE
ncbi:MAG: RNA polymerase subunit sigma [Phycisphaerae bacterium]|nr:RNA polymerase subunit sigma [Phycisphaerae bacterium]